MSEGYIPMNSQPLLVVISGPSGVGKDSVLKELKQRKAPLHFVVNATTRPPRAEEEEGVDYFFISSGRFAEMIEQGEFLEYALVYNDFKGIPKEQIRRALESGRDVILRVDVQGANTIRKLCPEAVLIFMTVEDEGELVERLRVRNTEAEDNLKLRLATIRQEMKRISEFDYVIVNRKDELNKTADTVLAIIRAEHHRVKHRKVSLS